MLAEDQHTFISYLVFKAADQDRYIAQDKQKL